MAFLCPADTRYALAVVWLRVLWRFYARVAKSNFSALDCMLSIFALPLFCLLLVRSWWRHTVRSEVAWKGRAYSTTNRERPRTARGWAWRALAPATTPSNDKSGLQPAQMSFGLPGTQADGLGWDNNRLRR